MSATTEAPLTTETLPDSIPDVDALEELLSRPSQTLIDDLAALDGDIIVLGVGGKVGPCLARLAKRAAPQKRVVGVARFSDPAVRERLEAWGVETIACDLLDRAAVEGRGDNDQPVVDLSATTRIARGTRAVVGRVAGPDGRQFELALTLR